MGLQLSQRLCKSSCSPSPILGVSFNCRSHTQGHLLQVLGKPEGQADQSSGWICPPSCVVAFKTKSKQYSETSRLVVTGVVREWVWSFFKVPFPENCHNLTCLLVPWKTPFTRLSLFNLTQCCLEWRASSLGLLVENNQKQLVNN